MRPRLIAPLSMLVPPPLVSPARADALESPSLNLTGPWWLSQPGATRQDFVQGWIEGYGAAWLSAQGRLLALVEDARRAVPRDRKLAAALLVSV